MSNTQPLISSAIALFLAAACSQSPSTEELRVRLYDRSLALEEKLSSTTHSDFATHQEARPFSYPTCGDGVAAAAHFAHALLHPTPQVSPWPFESCSPIERSSAAVVDLLPQMALLDQETLAVSAAMGIVRNAIDSLGTSSPLESALLVADASKALDTVEEISREKGKLPESVRGAIVAGANAIAPNDDEIQWLLAVGEAHWFSNLPQKFRSEIKPAEYRTQILALERLLAEAETDSSFQAECQENLLETPHFCRVAGEISTRFSDLRDRLLRLKSQRS